MSENIPFRIMRMQIAAVEMAVSKLVTQDDFPDDKTYIALTYGMLEATGKNRKITRKQMEARLVAWVMHFNNGVKLLPENCPIKAEMEQAKIEFGKWVVLPETEKETA